MTTDQFKKNLKLTCTILLTYDHVFSYYISIISVIICLHFLYLFVHVFMCVKRIGILYKFEMRSIKPSYLMNITSYSRTKEITTN